MSSPTASTSKDEWRTQFRKHRRELQPEVYAAHSALICSRTLTLPAVAHASVVHVYWPLTDQGEVDTRLLIAALQGQNVDVVLPVVTSYDPASPTMEHRQYDGPSTLKTNRWGIREPVGTDQISPNAIDVVIVPALGAGRNGHRIGHGSGYYDAFLNTVTAPRVALVYDACLAPTLPAAPHDVPVTSIVTEKEVLSISTSSPSAPLPPESHN